MSKLNMDWWNHQEKQIYYDKYVFFMVTSIITTISTNATEKEPFNWIELADFCAYKAWHRIFVAGLETFVPALDQKM